MINEFLRYDFMRMALITGILVGILSGMLGVFVVQKKMSFLGNGLSHSALGGIGLGILLGIEPMFIAVPFVIIISILMFLIKEKTKLEIDSSIGIISSASIALGIVFISLKTGYVADAYSFLFGSILAISRLDVIYLSIITVIIVSIIIIYWERLAYSTFDRDLAIADGINVVKLDYLLSILLAIFIITAIKLVGIVLISAFLILPSSIAILFSKTFLQLTIISIILGVLSSILGLYISFLIDLPSGATIILLQVCIFIISYIYNWYNY